MEKIKVYQWTLFYTSEYEFEHFIGRSKLDVNRKAWEKFEELRKEMVTNTCFDYASANDIVEFCSKRYNYISSSTVGSVEFEFTEYEI